MPGPRGLEQSGLRLPDGRSSPEFRAGRRGRGLRLEEPRRRHGLRTRGRRLSTMPRGSRPWARSWTPWSRGMSRTRPDGLLPADDRDDLVAGPGLQRGIYGQAGRLSCPGTTSMRALSSLRITPAFPRAPSWRSPGSIKVCNRCRHVMCTRTAAVVADGPYQGERGPPRVRDHRPLDQLRHPGQGRHLPHEPPLRTSSASIP